MTEKVKIVKKIEMAPSKIQSQRITSIVHWLCKTERANSGLEKSILSFQTLKSIVLSILTLNSISNVAIFQTKLLSTQPLLLFAIQVHVTAQKLNDGEVVDFVNCTTLHLGGPLIKLIKFSVFVWLCVYSGQFIAIFYHLP